MSLIFELAGYFGIASGLAQQIVNAIDYGAAALVIISILASWMSAGLLAGASASIDYVILVVKSMIARNLKLQAVVW